MSKVLLVLGAAALIAGCARESVSEPSYLGVQPALADETDGAANDAPSSVLDRVSSGKVLGAMAFEKATGMPVEPTRLSK